MPSGQKMQIFYGRFVRTLRVPHGTNMSIAENKTPQTTYKTVNIKANKEEYAIKINNVTKRFKGYSDRAVTLKEKLIFNKRRKYTEREVLKNISLNIEHGEVIGLIGENGCGKSTLLKLMTGILYPEEGSIEINGRVSSLLELGAGFHPDMSGRDNVYTNASIFGLTKKETDEKFQEILDFSELHEYIDNPVRTYSSGMFTRLAFSVAINVNADVLLIDEILAVGDSNFQSKCYDKLKQLKKSGITIVIVTHDIGIIESFCNRAIWINKGRIAKDGDRYKVADAYKKYMNDKKSNLLANGKDFDRNDVYYVYNFFLGRAPESNKIVNECCNAYRDLAMMTKIFLQTEEFLGKKEKLGFANKTDEEILREFDSYKYKMRHQSAEDEKLKSEGKLFDDTLIDNTESEVRFGNKNVYITDVKFVTSENEDAEVINEGERVQIQIYYKRTKEVDRYIFGIDFYTLDEVHCVGMSMRNDRFIQSDLNDVGIVTCDVSEFNLVAGEYKMGVYIQDESYTALDYIREYKTFYVVSKQVPIGIAMLKHSWSNKGEVNE